MQPPHLPFGLSTVQYFGDATGVAQTCLSENKSIAAITVYYIDDEQSHNEAEQARLLTTLESDFEKAEKELESAFGRCERAVWNQKTYEWGAEVKRIPISGIALASFWQVNQQTLYLAASKEDRETPFILIVGVTQA